VFIISITKDEKKQLIKIGYKVIESENLPVPSNIKILSPFAGIRTRNGTCILQKRNNSYKIIIYSRVADYENDPKGKFINDKTGIKCRRLAVGKDRSLNEIKETLAHEIAHLKFWDHGAQHKSYTNHILNKIEELC